MDSRERKFGSSGRLLLMLPSSGERVSYLLGRGCRAGLAYSYAGLLLQMFPEFSHVVRETDQPEWLSVKTIGRDSQGCIGDRCLALSRTR